jgi:class 3 adenylate cyclase
VERDASGVTKAVMFGDLSGFTALTEAHGDGGAADVAGRFFDLAAGVLPEDARVVKTIGDAVMIVADDSRSGLDAALGVLRAVGREEAFPGVRIGLNAGPIVERVGDVFGATVNAAARLTEHAHVGQLLTTRALASLVAEADQVAVTALGPTHLKNIGDPIEIFLIEDELRCPTVEVLDPVCRMYVDADDAPARLPWGERIWLFCSFECATKFSANPERYTAG